MTFYDHHIRPAACRACAGRGIVNTYRWIIVDGGLDPLHAKKCTRCKGTGRERKKPPAQSQG